MALKIDEIMDLSLDDYIAISKKSSNNNAVTNHSKHEMNNTLNYSIDAKFGRRKGNIDDEEEDEDELLITTTKEELNEDVAIEEIDTGIWKGPDSSVSYLDCNSQQNDLRDKLNNSNNRNGNQQVSSVQYRMMAPNNAANRPRGIPTLLPLDVQVNNNRSWINNRNNKKGNRGGNRGYNNFRRGFNNNSGNNFNESNASFGLGGVINGRIQRNRKQDFESKNLRFSVARNNSNNNPNQNSNIGIHKPAQNMIIETPSNYINLVPSPPLNSSFKIPHHSTPNRNNNNSSGSQSFPIGNLTPQAEAALNLNSCGIPAVSPTGGSNESLKSLLGFQGNVSGEMMPVFASRLMDFLQNGLQNPAVHKPVYDMKIQKDIHEIQKKPLLYKCPGGEVVSSDGAGVNCKIIPRTSGVSLNCRFA
ncbi:hypothetical protein FF38_06064 [Lucilia cuprina]|uniref:Uncharacterized protein n=1 Tax=Lucilia cuprina TaxID=7375 RepID=A0A0L0CM27_LUCCU|nr:dr1-associated corepressor homolog [Lucilia cuprina]KAI8126906.1 hypothetical protein CVS40_3139 [Lucilia cuprina]KNC33297.1 hypothetical protein FF38_06064 [Lucilia cuprina]